ncbi:hypothetical protein M9Y10_022624 [Tritrichomonas musculus]|uniref:Uncharacterized protein n=1 Tax=Tritrichomonas musculus TaxID=1915356 RepID=A0ABR2KT53_9EUKA
MMNKCMFSEMNYQDHYFLTMDIYDNSPIRNIPLYFDDEDELDFRLIYNQIQPRNKGNEMFMNEGKLDDINTELENDLSALDQEIHSNY